MKLHMPDKFKELLIRDENIIQLEDSLHPEKNQYKIKSTAIKTNVNNGGNSGEFFFYS
jgi:hypothetical protein